MLTITAFERGYPSEQLQGTGSNIDPDISWAFNTQYMRSIRFLLLEQKKKEPAVRVPINLETDYRFIDLIYRLLYYDPFNRMAVSLAEFDKVHSFFP